MAAIALAFGASLVAGISVGALAAILRWVRDVRPRSVVSEHAIVIERCAAASAFLGVALAAAGVASADRLQAPLGLTCAAAAVLLAVATWLLLIEWDDGGEPVESDEPRWWPQFERDLAEWTRRSRVPTNTRG